jgi:transposase/IS5 family transposase
MRKFKRNDRNQLMVLPPNLNDWLPPDHLARFLVEAVDRLDLGLFYAVHEDARGGPAPYDPEIMLAILLYGYMTGVYSSRKLEEATWTDIAFRFVATGLHPDHDTIADFRKRHEVAITRVFEQVVGIAMQARIVRLGHVSVDGTKIRANASKEKRRSKEQLENELKMLKSWIGKVIQEAERIDAEEDKEFGKGNNGYRLPNELKTPEQRAEFIEKALRELEEQQKEQEKNDPDGKRKRAREQKKGGKEVRKINTTDFDSRTMLFRNGVFDEGYNTQIVVDDDHGIIVAADVSQNGGDKCELLPMVLQVGQNTGWLPERVTADAGYFSESQMTDARVRKVEFYVKPKKQKVMRAKSSKLTFGDHMRERMESPIARFLYQMRMTLVEPAFGAIKQARGFRQFKLRGLQGVKAEWSLVCMAHNLKKMFNLSPSLALLLE